MVLLYQYVRLKSHSYESSPGVPQGFMLEPLLFMVFVIDDEHMVV